MVLPAWCRSASLTEGPALLRTAAKRSGRDPGGVDDGPVTLSSTGPGEGPAGDLDLPGYVDLLEHVKTEVRTARVRAARAVNIELVQAYWRVGKLILTRQQEQGWGTKVIDRLARDLRTEFPQMRGWSPRNLRYMRTMAAVWPDPIGQHPVAQLPWGHVTVLLDKIDEQPVRDWYITQTLRHGWSRTTLVHHIATGRHARVGQALDNFTATLPESHTDLVREIIHDPYDLDFLAIDPGYSERQLEDALITRLTTFLTELGQGFAFVGRQYRFPIGDRDFYADLVFFHLGLRRFVIIELKIGTAEPEHLGQLAFYVNAADDLLRRPDRGDDPTIGILLVTDRDDVVVEYALRATGSPLAVSTYTAHHALPADVQTNLPTPDDLAAIVRTTRHPPR